MVLENKLGITDSSELARMEEKISEKIPLDLFNNVWGDIFLSLLSRKQKTASQKGRLPPFWLLKVGLEPTTLRNSRMLYRLSF